MTEFVVPAHLRKLAWSYSAIAQYENCPHQYYRIKVKRDVKTDFSSPALARGSEVHEIFEKVIKDPSHYDKLHVDDMWIGDVAKRALAAAERADGELELCLNADLEPVEWFDRKAWARAKIDAVLHREGKPPLLVDWKTGRYRPSDQPEYVALVYMLANKDVQEVHTAWVWVDPAEHGEEPTFLLNAYDRDALPAIWDKLISKLDKIAYSRKHKHWPKANGPRCRWCDVADCEYAGG